MTHRAARPDTTIGAFAAACLAENQIDTVFGIPGTHNIEIYRGIREQGIRHVLTRHEQGAIYAADGYARATGRPGVVVATSGPGITNCITGIANAYADSVPLLVLSPGPSRGQERRDIGFLHEAKDQRSGIDRFARASVRIESRDALQEAIHRTFLEFRTGRPRPVHIEIPTDVMAEYCDPIPESRWQAELPMPSAEAVSAVSAALLTARRPLIVVGGGAGAAEAELTALVDHTGVPVVTTVAGKGVVSERHPRSLGALAGGTEGFAALERADLVLAFGTELKNATLDTSARVARFDIDAGQLHKHHRADFPVLGDTGLSAAALLRGLEDDKPALAEGWLEEVRAAARTAREAAKQTWGKLHAAVLEAAEASPERGVVLTGDSSQISWLGTVRTAVLERARSFLTTDGYATLGYSLPAAIGAKIARPGSHVVSILGDGALMFSVQEMLTAAALRLPLPILVFDNGGYAEIQQNMRDARMEPFAVELNPPDYRALAAAMHCDFAEVGVPEELVSTVRHALHGDRPTLIRVQATQFNAVEWRS